MKYHVMKRWVKALRSGDYAQTTGTLNRIKPDLSESFCCLGVLCDVELKRGGFKIITNSLRNANPHCEDETYVAYNGQSGSLATDIRETSGIKNPTLNKLINLNDSAKKNFKEIADFIEENWRVL